MHGSVLYWIPEGNRTGMMTGIVDEDMGIRFRPDPCSLRGLSLRVAGSETEVNEVRYRCRS
jgi:hypothetical protein